MQGAEDAYKGVELMHIYHLSKDTTLGELENPKQCAEKITIRAKKENGEFVYLD